MNLLKDPTTVPDKHFIYSFLDYKEFTYEKVKTKEGYLQTVPRPGGLISKFGFITYVEKEEQSFIYLITTGNYFLKETDDEKFSAFKKLTQIIDEDKKQEALIDATQAINQMSDLRETIENLRDECELHNKMFIKQTFRKPLDSFEEYLEFVHQIQTEYTIDLFTKFRLIKEEKKDGNVKKITRSIETV